MQSADSLINEETLFQQEDSPPPLRRSLSPEETSCADSESIMGSMEPDLDMSITHTRCFTEPALATQQPVSIGNRAHSTASCEPSRRGEYEKMIHPHAALYNKGGYIYMKPAEGGQQESHYANPQSVPLPYAHLQQHMHQSAQSDDMYQHLQHFPSRSPAAVDMSRKNVQAYDRLPPIKEAQIAEEIVLVEQQLMKQQIALLLNPEYPCHLKVVRYPQKIVRNLLHMKIIHFLQTFKMSPR